MRYVFTLLGFLLFSGVIFSQNTCDVAFSVDGADGSCLEIDFSNQSSDSFNTDCTNTESDHNQWYYFTAEGPQLSVVANHDQGANVYISLIRFTSGECDPVKYTTVECDVNNLFGNDLLIEGKKYFIIINVENNQTGLIDLCVNNPDVTPPPANDLPCDAVVIIPDSTCVYGTTVYAEQDIDTFQCAPEFTNEVWYEFTLSDGLFFGVEVYLTSDSLEGDVRAALIEFVDDNCSNEFIIKQQYCGQPNGFLFDYVSLQPSSKYYVAVATSPEEDGEFNLCIKEMEALAHTDPCNALDVIPNDACISFDTYYSLFEYDLPNCDFSNQKIWYKFYTGTELNEIALELEKLGEQENVFLGLGYFQGNWCENQFHWVDTYCGDVANAKFEAKDLMPYQLYHVVVGTNFGFTGKFDLCINGDYNSPYTNDTACKAYDIDNISNCIGGSSEYGALITDDTLCFGVSPIKKTWYKVELNRFDYNVNVDFTALSTIPVHRLELGYFENGCLDSFLIVNQSCGTLPESSTTYEFPDSIDYAYIAVSLPNDQVYNYSICVNAPDISEECRANDFCQEAEFQGVLTLENTICFDACTFGSTPENTEEYYSSHYSTVWYILETEEEVNEIEITFSDATSSAFFIGLTDQNECNYSSFDISRFVQLTSQSSIRLDVKPNSSYKLAIAAIDDFGGSISLCIQGQENNTCSTLDKLTIQAASMGSPLEGPFQEGEVISMCYQIEEFDIVNEASCQWLQGIVPSFGNGWSASSFNEVGLPVNATNINSVSNNVTWDWRNDVHSRVDNSYRRLSNSSFGLPDLCHIYEDNCDGVELHQGDLLPPGWYAWNNSQGIEHPDSTYGDGISCSEANGPWQICFNLIVGTIEDDTDLSVSFHTLSDGEIGLEEQVDTSCMEDMPLSERFFIECNNNPIDSTIQVLTCSGNVTTVDLPSNQFFFWISTGNDRISGINNGSGTSLDLDLTHLEEGIQEVSYLVRAYTENGCHLANYTLNVDVYPALDIAKEDLFTICQLDSVSMNEIIDLESQIIGDFTVEWNSDNLIDEVNAVWKLDQDEMIVYDVLSEAGCSFHDTLFIHVEDVIVSDYIKEFVSCKDDEFSMQDVINLDSIISDNFTVDWLISDIEDIPNALTSFSQSSAIPFVIEGETGCVFQDSLQIHVPFVAINVLGKDEYCSTDTVSISAGYQFEEPHTKFWILPNLDTIHASGLSRPASIFETGLNSLEFQLYTQEGCPFYDFDTIQIYDFPEFVFNQDSQFLGICPYDSLELAVEVFPNYFDVEWNTPFGSTMEESLVINQEGWYALTAGFENDKVSCINRDSFHLEIYPAVETEFVYDPIICEGDSSLIQSVDPNYIFVWSTGEFSSEVNLPEGEYTVTVANGPGCNSIFDISITEQMIPNPNFEFEDTLCEGDSTWIIADNDNYNYIWSNDLDSSAIISYGEDFTVTVTDNEMCIDSFEIDIDLISYPEVDFEYNLINDSLYLFNNSSNAEFCQWMINDDLLGMGEDTLLVLEEGDYIISLSCNNGACGDIVLDSISIILVGLEAQKITDWELFPNPNNGRFMLKFGEITQINSIEIFDVHGLTVFSQSQNALIGQLNIDAQLVPGVYFVQISSEGFKEIKRIIVH